MTMRKYLIATLVILSGATCVGHAATSPAVASGTSAKPTISDKEVVRYLTQVSQKDLAEWNQNVQDIADANREMQEGKKDQAAKADPNAVFKTDLTAQHAKGTQEMKEATAKLKLLNADQDRLRQIAIAKREEDKSGVAATEAATLAVTTGQWPDVYASMCDKVLGSLADQNYKQIYLAGVYAFEEPAYVAKPDLTAQVRQEILKFDKNKSFKDSTFTLGQDDGKLIISYPDRAFVQAGNTKAALIVGEVLYESHNGYAAVDLRAVDLSNMHIVANQIMMLSVDPSLGKALGLAIYKNMSKRIAPTPDSTDVQPAKTITVHLDDPNNVIADAKKVSFAFRVGTQGHPDTLENRFAILMLKSYFRDQQGDLGLSDQDFLSMVLPPDKPGDLAASPADVGGEWLVPDVADFDANMELPPLKLHILDNNSNHEVGKISITRDLPRLDNPSADDLRAGGYTASP